MKIIGIYKITSPNNKIYIGQSVDIESRFKAYKRNACKSQKKLYASFLKYGAINHIFEIIEECRREDLCEREKYFVNLYNTFNTSTGLNIRDGGGNKANLSEEQKKKISDSLRGIKHSKERIEKNRLAQIGKILTEETKKKIRNNNPKQNLGKKASAETRLKQSIAQKGKIPWIKGKIHSEETKIKLRQINLGSNNPNFGLHRSLETKNKTSNTLKGHIVSEDTRKKISLNNKGKKKSVESVRKAVETRRSRGKWKVTEETRNKMSIARKGIKLSEETKLKISLAKRKKFNNNL